MNRLTKRKNHYGDYTINEKAFSLGEDEYQCCVNALGWYEDFEDKLGIDLIVLFKALKDGIYIKNNNSIYKIESDELNISLRNNGYIIQELYFEDLDGVLDTTGCKWYLEDYGKTWALTKGELKNE